MLLTFHLFKKLVLYWQFSNVLELFLCQGMFGI